MKTGFKFAPAKIVPKDTKQNSDEKKISVLLQLLKDEKDYSALEFLFENMPIEIAIELTKELICKSKYRTFRQAMNKFETVYNHYVIHKDNSVLDSYLKTMDFNYGDSLYHLQIMLEKITIAMQLKKSSYLCSAIYYFITELDDMQWNGTQDAELNTLPEEKKKFKSLVINFAIKTYPGASGLKVLYGDNK